MSDNSMRTVVEMIEAQGAAWADFQERYAADSARLAQLDSDFRAAEVKAGRARVFGGDGSGDVKSKPTQWIDTKSHRRVPVLDPADRLADVERKADEPQVSIGRFLRGITLGGAADDAKELAEERKALSIGTDPAGGFTVGGTLAREWIDLLRAEMVLTRAGARTVPMDGKTLTLARLTGDPAVSWHGENAAIAAGDPTLGAVTLSAKTLVGVVKLSLELSQDSANIEEILSRSLVQATAHAIDSAGLVGVSTNAAAAPSGIFDLSGRNTVTSIGAPANWDWLVDGMAELMLDNVPADRIGAMIAHPALWKTMRKLKTGLTSDNTSLVPPPEVAALPKLWTTAAPLAGGTTAKAIVADWRDLLFGVRQDISVRVLTEAFMGSNLQVAVLVFARCDFAPTRAASFVTCEGITVG